MALRLTDPDIAAWRAYERAAARAVDQYEALPIAHWTSVRVAKCTRCRTDVPSHGLCRACRRVK
jgi:hypothetical protein